MSLGQRRFSNPSVPFLGPLAPLAFRTLAACTLTWGEEDFEPVAHARDWGEGGLTEYLITSFYLWGKGAPLNLFKLFVLARKRGYSTIFN